MPPRPQGRQQRRVPGATPRDPRFVRARDGGARSRAPLAVRLRAAARVGAVAVLLLGSGWYVQDVMTSGEAFRVTEIQPIGTVRLSVGEVEALLHGLRGRNIVLADLEAWRRRLLASPWVRDASLRRALPGRIEVRITERVPMAVAHAGDVLLLIDEQGEIVDEYGPRYGALDLPIVEGLLGKGPVTAAPPDPARVAVVADALQSLGDAGLLGRISQLDVTDVRNVSVLLSGDPVLLKVGHEKFAERVQAYLDMQERLAQMVQGVEWVDLRFENRVYVRPRKPGVTFASMPPLPEEGAVEEALAQPEDGDGQQ
jgi:cell division protein FtsQ